MSSTGAPPCTGLCGMEQLHVPFACGDGTDRSQHVLGTTVALRLRDLCLALSALLHTRVAKRPRRCEVPF